MKFCSARFGFAQSLVALSVSIAVVVSSHTFAFASPTHSSPSSQNQPKDPQSELRVIEATASTTATAAGVLIQWRTNSATDNLGFNVYRLKGGQRLRLNKEIIPGAVFAPDAPLLLRGGHSYSWFDRSGNSDSTYFIESVSLYGVSQLHEAIKPVVSKTIPGFGQTSKTRSSETSAATESASSFEKYYPSAGVGLDSPAGALENQWAIAAQTALKISIKKDGWYRVTQTQIAAAGFNPTVDIRNLRLFAEANEVAISTNQLTGQFGSGDYIEFYGRGLDTATADSRIYYLVAGTTPGKRVRGELQLDSQPIDQPSPTPNAFPSAPPMISASQNPLLRDPIFYSWIQNDVSRFMDLNPPNPPIKRDANDNGSPADNTQPGDAPSYSPPAEPQPAAAVERAPLAGTRGVPDGRTKEQNATTPSDLVTLISTAPKANAKNAPSLPLPVPTRNIRSPRRGVLRGKLRKRSVSRKRTRGTPPRENKQERNHAAITAAATQGFQPVNFGYTAERKDRTVYFVSLLNGDKENYFGQVIGYNPSNPASQTINTPNPDLTAPGPARLEIALQGANLGFHDVSVEFNGVVVGSFSFFGRDNLVQVFNVPVTQLQNGANTIRFLLSTGPDTTIVDYVKLSYPHTFRADASSLRFDLRGTQSVKVDGFTTPSVRLIDYTDPLNVGITKPASEPSGSGFAVNVPPSDPPSKSSRLLYAIPEGQFDQPASLSLNQPSSLNLNSNACDFLIVAHKDLIASLEPLRVARANQGMAAKVVDVEDVYDEFSYGVHGPQAVKDFLSYASTHWVTRPRYIIFAGDASLDPRNYQGVGNFDLVPTKLVDATYSETASDDWLADFDDDGIADIPVGRIPVRTAADANLVVSKIINFTPVTPESALLVADDPTGYYFDFEDANNQVQALLPAGVTVQKSYRRLEFKLLTGTVSTNSGSGTVTGTGTLFTTSSQLQVGTALTTDTGERLGTVASIQSATSLTLRANALSTYTGAFGKQDDATASAHIIAGFNEGRAVTNYAGHGNVDVWTGGGIFKSSDALALTNGNKLSFVVVMDCLNGYFQEPGLLSLSEALLEAPSGGAVAAFASSGLTLPDGQLEMSHQLYSLIYGAQPIALGDAIKLAKNATNDIDVRRTWIFFGDPSIKIR